MLADQIEAVQRASVDKGLATPDLSLLVDGLRAEREQGITIDVAYRYFSTPQREFVLADTPGHVQYTRNTVTGASTAELAVLLVDARNGIVEQTRRHAAVLALLRVPRLVLAINKIDLVDYDEETLTAIAKDFAALARSLGFPDDAVVTIPVSALVGDNVVEPLGAHPLVRRSDAARAPGVGAGGRAGAARAVPDAGAVRDPAQAARAATSCTTTAATPARSPSGTVRAGRRGRRAARRPAHHGGGGRHRGRAAGRRRRGPERDGAARRRHRHLPRRPARRRGRAAAGDERAGDDAVLARREAAAPRRPAAAQARHPDHPGDRRGDHASGWTRRRCGFGEPPAQLQINDIAHVGLRTADALPVDDYADVRATGSFLLIDPPTGNTLAAGLVGYPLADALG